MSTVEKKRWMKKTSSGLCSSRDSSLSSIGWIFTFLLRRELTTEVARNISQHLICVATLPRELFMAEQQTRMS